MGDRVLFQVISSANKPTEFSPVLYGHWCGSRAPSICAAIKARMRGRPGVSYTAARLVQEAIGYSNGNLSYGLSNAEGVLTAEDSHGDAGIVLVDVTGPVMHFECLGGYLTTDGDTVTSPYDQQETGT